MAESQPQVDAHVPAMVWRHKVEEKSMTKIRRMPGIERGNRMLYIFTVSENPFPITMLSGDEFLSAWWQVVLGHYNLWKHGVHHRDVSPGNLRVYRSDGRWIGVINDHDLSLTQRNSPASNERTGTIPFMAIDLLKDDTFEEKVTHLYRDNAESFVWVLVWVCLRYKDGKLLRVREGRLLDEWLKVDGIRCRGKKCSFQRTFRFGDAEDTDIQPSSSHISN